MNRKEIYRNGFTYIVTRRIVRSQERSAVRVRVVSYKGFATKNNTPIENVFKDYVSYAEGDAVFNRHIEKLTK